MHSFDSVINLLAIAHLIWPRKYQGNASRIIYHALKSVYLKDEWLIPASQIHVQKLAHIMSVLELKYSLGGQIIRIVVNHYFTSRAPESTP